MKKLNLFALIAMLFSVTLFVACSNDDDETKDDDGDKNYAEMIIGWWQVIESSTGYDEDEFSSIFKINEDGSYWNGNDNGSDSGKWEIEGNIFKFKSKFGLSFEVEITEITDKNFTAKSKNPITGTPITTKYKRVK